ncbi:MAG: histidinol dehydrogenase, partial [Methylobacteriaceae bacterium]|nr:histidinol dehydrogenase [Methylobacteriaceae bacterium]
MTMRRSTPAGVRFIKAPAGAGSTAPAGLGEAVAAILTSVKARGDAALRDYSREFDKVEVDAFEVTQAERAAAVAALDPQTRADTEFAIERVRAFAAAQMAALRPVEIEALPGLHLGHRVIPIERVGCYVPGGRYPLLSA